MGPARPSDSRPGGSVVLVDDGVDSVDVEVFRAVLIDRRRDVHQEVG
jgi:hypothetical protein